MTESSLCVDVKNLVVHYPDGRVALNGVSFSVSAGESVAILGANGAGKTTLLLALVGVLPADGEIRFGESLLLSQETLKEIRRNVQLVFQDPDDQLFMPRVRDDIAFGPLNFGVVPVREIAKHVEKLLASVGLEGFGDRSPHSLSLGERKRVAIAAALACNPQVILLDEPSAGLDAPGRRQLLHVLQKTKATKLVATHDLEFARLLCKRAVILKSGRVAAEGPLENLLADKYLLYSTGLR